MQPIKVELPKHSSRQHADNASLDSWDSENTVNSRKEVETLIVDWEGPDDPENPKNWSTSKKWIATILVSAYAFTSPAASAMIAPASKQVDAEFNITNQVVSALITSVFVFAYAFGPLILGPLSELYGRNIIIQLSNAWFLIFNIACGLARNESELVAFRFLAGFGGSAPLGIGGAFISDCFSPQERGSALSIFAISPILGPILGPLAGAWVAEKASWRWAFWSTSILTGVVQVVGLIVIRETYAPVLLKWKANRIRQAMDEEQGSSRAVKTIFDLDDRSWKRHVLTVLVRPFALFIYEPILQILSFYMAFMYGIFYLFLTTLPTIFGGVYKEDVGTAGLHYLALGIGMVGGAQICAYFQDKIYVRLTKKNGDTAKPEFRLPLLFPGCVLTPIGLLITAWTARADIHWIVPDIGLIFAGLGIMIPWLSINSYLIDTFSLYAASALATVIFLRSVFGFGFPLFAPMMYSALGLGKANTILAAVTIFIGFPAPFVFWYFGERIRLSSKYARK